MVLATASGGSRPHVPPPPPFTKPDEIIPVAGGGPDAVPSSGIPAVYARLSNPGGVAVDPSGDVFIADTDDNEVREVSPNGTITTIAGNGIAGNTGNGGSATAAELDHPEGVAVDGSGNVFVADTGNDEVRLISGGIITDFAGTGVAGDSTNRLNPTESQLDAPYGVAVSANGGDVAISDTNNDDVRLVYKQAIDSGAAPKALVAHAAVRPHFNLPYVWVIETVAGGGTSYGDGGPALDASLSTPTGVAFDPSGDTLYVADTSDSAIRAVNLGTGDISTAAYTPYPTGVAADGAGNLFIADPEQNEVLEQLAGASSPVRFAGSILPGSSGDFGQAKAAHLDYPAGLAIDASDDVVVADTSNGLVREVVAPRAPVFVGDSPPLDFGPHQAYDYLFSATGVAEPTFSLAAGAPSWLSISSTTGFVKGTAPVGVTRFTYSVVATNEAGSATAGPFEVAIPKPFIYTGKALAVLTTPVGVAETPAGDLLVADAVRDRVDGLSAIGQFLGSFGSAGTGNGQFEAPTGVATAPSGAIYVVDSGNDRVQEFTALGVFVRAFGSKGTGNGQFMAPDSVTVGPNGNVYVSDSGNDRIEEFTASGGFVRAFGSPGSGNGQLSDPEGLVFTSLGVLLVADSNNNRIEGFLSNGAYFAKFGAVGSAFGDFVRPFGVAVDPAGNIFVSDRVNNRVEEFSSTGEPIQQFGATGAAGQRLEQPDDLAVSATDVVTIADPPLHEVLQYTEESKPAFTIDSPPTGAIPGIDFTYYFRASGVPAPTYTLEGAPGWLSLDPSSGDLGGTVPSGISTFSFSVVATNSSGSTTAGPFTVSVVAGGYIQRIGSPGSGPGQFGGGVGQSATAPDGNLYVADPTNDRVEILSPLGQYLGEVGSPGSGNGQLSDPIGVAFDSGGDLWVTDYGNERVEEFSSAGIYLSQFGSAGSAPGEFESPEGIAIDTTTNDVYVADTADNRVEEFSSTGTLLHDFTTVTGAPLYAPIGVAVTSTGELYFGNNETAQIVGFNSSGVQNATYLTAGTGDGQADGVSGVALDSSGNLWFADYPNRRIEELSPNGTYLDQFGGTYGTGPDQFTDPGQLSVSPLGIVSVSDNGQLEQFAEPPPAPTYLGQFGSAGSGNGQFDQDSDVAIGPNGDFYVVDRASPT